MATASAGQPGQGLLAEHRDAGGDAGADQVGVRRRSSAAMTMPSTPRASTSSGAVDDRRRRARAPSAEGQLRDGVGDDELLDLGSVVRVRAWKAPIRPSSDQSESAWSSSSSGPVVAYRGGQS